MAYLAAITKRVQLVTGILILPQRQTVLVAKQGAEVDVLSGGRLRLGIQRYSFSIRTPNDAQIMIDSVGVLSPFQD